MQQPNVSVVKFDEEIAEGDDKHWVKGLHIVDD